DPRRLGQSAAVYTYDARLRRTTSENGAHEVTHYNYDGNDNVVRMTDPIGNGAGARYTTYAYDELNTLRSVDETARGGGKTSFLNHNTRTLHDQPDAYNTLVATFDSDALTRVTDVTQYSGRGPLHWHYGYDDNDNQTLVQDHEGQVTSMTYDYLDRLKTVTYLNEALPNLTFRPFSITYGYDDNGNVTDVTEVKSGTTPETANFEYDKLDRLKLATNYDNKTVTYTYDVQGNLRSLTDPDGQTTTYNYDARDRLTDVTFPGDTGSPATVHYDYWKDNLVKDIIYPNGVIEDYGFADSYDDAGRLTFVVSHTGHPGQLPAPAQFLPS